MTKSIVFESETKTSKEAVSITSYRKMNEFVFFPKLLLKSDAGGTTNSNVSEMNLFNQISMSNLYTSRSNSENKSTQNNLLEWREIMDKIIHLRLPVNSRKHGFKQLCMSFRRRGRKRPCPIGERRQFGPKRRQSISASCQDPSAAPEHTSQYERKTGMSEIRIEHMEDLIVDRLSQLIHIGLKETRIKEPVT